jgi:ABC-type multidrug transport system ATPase subunit
LSGGNQQKVMIGRAFALKPRILILNDPARGIDVGSKGEIYRQLREYASHGNSVVYLSTEIEEFIGFCSRVLVFRDHSVFDAFEGQEIDTHRILEAMFGQTPGVGGASRPESLALESTASVKDMKIVEFGKDKKMVTKDDIGPIKIKDFGREESDLENVSSAREETHGKGRPEQRRSLRHDEPHPPRQMKIIDYDQEYAEKKIREKLGPMKIIDVDQQATREKDREWRRTREMHESGIGKIKIVESDA